MNLPRGFVGDAGLAPSSHERFAAAAVELVAGRGFEEVSAAEICAAAGLPTELFAALYEDEEDCLLRTHGLLAEDLCLRVRAAFAAPGRWQDRLWAAGTAAVSFLQEDPPRALFLLAAANGLGRRALSRRDALVAAIADIVEDGRSEAPGRAPSRARAEMVAGSIYAVLLAKAQEGAFERREPLLPELVYLATMPYLGPRGAEAALRVQPLR